MVDTVSTPPTQPPEDRRPAPYYPLCRWLYYPLCRHVLIYDDLATMDGRPVGGPCPTCAPADAAPDRLQTFAAFEVITLPPCGGRLHWQLRRHGLVCGYVSTSPLGLTCWTHNFSCTHVDAVAAVCAATETEVG